MPVNGVLPVASIFDANANPVSSEILLNGNGNYVIQATGLTPGATYYLQVSAAPAPSPRDRQFLARGQLRHRRRRRADVRGGTLSASELENQYTLYVAESQLFQFVLSTATDGVPTNAQVSMQIYNSAGAVVFSLTGRVGDTVSGASVLLTPGSYNVTISVLGTSGAAVPSIGYHLSGGNLSDPIGPASADPTEEPMYPCPGNPAVDCYCYPNGTYSTTPYQVSSTK